MENQNEKKVENVLLLDTQENRELSRKKIKNEKKYLFIFFIIFSLGENKEIL